MGLVPVRTMGGKVPSTRCVEGAQCTNVTGDDKKRPRNCGSSNGVKCTYPGCEAYACFDSPNCICQLPIHYAAMHADPAHIRDLEIKNSTALPWPATSTSARRGM